MYRAFLESDEYGYDNDFEYDTLEEALEGVKRLRKSADEYTKQDGIVRRVGIEGEFDYDDCDDE